MECWKQKTPFQTALFLILLVSAPFLIIMLIIYGVIFYYYNVDCVDVCLYKQTRSPTVLKSLDEKTAVNKSSEKAQSPKKYTAKTRSFPNVDYDYENQAPNSIDKDYAPRDYADEPEVLPMDYYSDNQSFVRKRETKRSCYYPRKSAFPFLVSIFETLYSDDFDTTKFLCSGVIITGSFVLTASDCVIEAVQTSKLNHIFVRSSSDYWSKEGIVYLVDYVVFGSRPTTFPIKHSENLSKLAALHVVPKIPIHSDIADVVQIPAIPIIVNDDDGYSFRWWNNVTFKGQKKFKKAEESMAKVRSRCFGGEGGLICSFEQDRCMNTKGAPLLSKEKVLLGIQIGAICKNHSSIFVYKDTTRLKGWIAHVLNVTRA